MMGTHSRRSAKVRARLTTRTRWYVQSGWAVFLLIAPVVSTVALLWKGLGWWALLPALAVCGGLVVAWFIPQPLWQKVAPDPHADAKRRLGLKSLLGEQDQKAIALVKKKATSDEIDGWIVETTQLIASAVGMGEATRFVSNAGLSGIQITEGMKQDDATNLAYRRQRLAELISRVDTLAIEPTFDS
jgi:hypothetical protein